MPKGHSGSHYNNLSFLQLLVSCSVVKFNLRRVNRIFPPNASLLTIINLLLSTKRALLWNEIEDPPKTSGKHRELFCVQYLFGLQICLSACACMHSWVPSCREVWVGIILSVCFSLQWQKVAYLTVVYTLYSCLLPGNWHFLWRRNFWDLRDELLP